jgi:hypothetical protein
VRRPRPGWISVGPVAGGDLGSRPTVTINLAQVVMIVQVGNTGGEIHVVGGTRIEVGWSDFERAFNAAHDFDAADAAPPAHLV